MKLYFFIVGMALVMAIFSPEAMVLPAAQAAVYAPLPEVAGSSASSACETPSCRAGWQLAIERAISDEGECPLLSGAQEEIEGCRKFVRAGEQDRHVSEW